MSRVRASAPRVVGFRADVQELVDAVVRSEVAEWPHGFFPKPMARVAPLDPVVCEAALAGLGKGAVLGLARNPLVTGEVLAAIYREECSVAAQRRRDSRDSWKREGHTERVAVALLLNPNFPKRLHRPCLKGLNPSRLHELIEDDGCPDAVMELVVQRLQSRCMEWESFLGEDEDLSAPDDVHPRLLRVLFDCLHAQYPDGVFDPDDAIEMAEVWGGSSLIAVLGGLWLEMGSRLQWPEEELLAALGDSGRGFRTTLRTMSQRKYVGYVSADAVTSREGFELAVARLRHLPGSVAEVLCDLDRVDVLCALIANQNLGEEFRVRAGEILVRKFGPSATKGKGKVWLAIAEGLMGIIRAKGAFPGCVREWLSELPADWPHVQDLLAMDAGWSVEDVEAEWSRLSIEPEPCRQVMQLIGNPSTPAHVLRDIYATYPSDVVVAQWLARAPGCPDDLRWQLMVEHKKSVGWLVWKHGTPPPRAASLLNHTLSGHKDHIKKLSDLYGPEDVVEHVVETQSLFALLEIYGEPAVPVAAGHPDPGMRLRLARFHHRRGVNHDWNHFLLMAHLACDPEVKVRAAAVQQLPPCLLERFIRDPEPAVRVAAVRNPSASPEVLIAASQDPSDAVRDAAATATVKALAS